MDKYYSVDIAGLKRDLKLFDVNENLSIAAFILFGDTEVTVAASKALLEKAPDFDYIITPEAKSIPLAYEMSRQSGKPYIVVRKGTKVYMGNPISIEVQSITTKAVQHLYLGEDEANLIKGKKVLLVDDVISTGESLKSLRSLIEKTGAIEAATCAVLAEGDAAERTDIIFLNKIPLFFK